MSNVCLSVMGIPAVTFSIVGGGDSIDRGASKSVVGYSVPKVVARKEKGINILSPNPTDDVEVALSIYYKNLINNVIKGFFSAVTKAEKVPAFDKPIEVVVAGGTSLAGGFLEYFNQQLTTFDFPFEISQCRLAKDPILAVSHGALKAALIKEKKKQR